jgi:hypothetical protein
MNLFRLLAIFIFASFCSCSKDYLFRKNQIYISEEIKAIKISDQSTRKLDALIDVKYKIRTFFTVADSLYEESVDGVIPQYNFSQIQSLDKQLSKLSSQKRMAYFEEKAEVASLMTNVDNNNKEIFYKIIKKFGFPSYDNRLWKDTLTVRIGSVFILTHYDDRNGTGKKIKKLMLKEYFKGRVNEGEMKQYLWSVDGRSGYPYDYNIDNARWKKILKDL